MPAQKTNSRVRCVFYTQIAFVTSLMAMGLLLMAAASASFNERLWSCPVFNTYYAVAWVTLGLRIAQFLLGASIGLFLFLQPRCADKGEP